MGSKTRSPFRYKKPSLLNRFWVVALVALAGIYAASIALQHHWFFELWSHFPIYFAIAFIVIALALLCTGRKHFSAIAVVLGIANILPLYPMWLTEEVPEGTYEEVTVLQYNVRKENDRVAEMARWIVSQSEKIDIMVLHEVHPTRWKDALTRIKWAYPYHISQDMRGGRYTVVLSRFLIDEFEVKYEAKYRYPIIILRGATWGYQVPFVLYGIHPPPPTIPDKAKQRNQYLEATAVHLADESAEYKLLVGDLNTTRFSYWYDTVLEKSGLKDGSRGLGMLSSWPSFLPNWLGIMIDHVLVSDDIYISQKSFGPPMGSDHLPVLTTLKFLVPNTE